MIAQKVSVAELQYVRAGQRIRFRDEDNGAWHTTRLHPIAEPYNPSYPAHRLSFHAKERLPTTFDFTL